MDRDAVVADRNTNQVFLLRDVRGAAEVTPIGGANTPVGVQVIHEDQVLLVVNAGDPSVQAIDLVSGNVIQTVALAGSATRCSALGGDVFLLNDPGSAPLLLLDASGPGYRSVFVPVQNNF